MTRFRLQPSDEFPHDPGDAPTFNESMYLNGFDASSDTGGWFRIGNRPNEGRAEMTVCIYLPDGKVAFMHQRPAIESNDALDAAGLTIDVREPLKRLAVHYAGPVLVLDDPRQMADPQRAFKDNPVLDAAVDLEYEGISPPHGGVPSAGDDDPVVGLLTGFAGAHYEQHVRVTGTIRVGDARHAIDGFGLRDKSWGPRSWQAIEWYRWLPMTFGPDFAAVLLLIGGDDIERAARGVVLRDGAHHEIAAAELHTERDADGYPSRITATLETAGERLDVAGEVVSLIPLRNRSTRIVEAMTRYTCAGQSALGMAEYLDQTAK